MLGVYRNNCVHQLNQISNLSKVISLGPSITSATSKYPQKKGINENDKNKKPTTIECCSWFQVLLGFVKIWWLKPRVARRGLPPVRSAASGASSERRSLLRTSPERGPLFLLVRTLRLRMGTLEPSLRSGIHPRLALPK
jgi:hypothetical protein